MYKLFHAFGRDCLTKHHHTYTRNIRAGGFLLSTRDTHKLHVGTLGNIHLYNRMIYAFNNKSGLMVLLFIRILFMYICVCTSFCRLRAQ